MDEDTRLHPAGAWPERPVDDTGAGSAGLLGALPEGWIMLGRCRTGTAGPATYPTGCYALAHAGTGVALVDVAPDATPNAEARLRRALSAANFWPAFPGVLPVWHGRIEPAAWRSLPGIMAEGFSDLPPLTVPGKGAWISAAKSALAEDVAWDVPGATPRGPRLIPAMSLGEDDDEVEPRPARRHWNGLGRFPGRRFGRVRTGLLLGFAATFLLGLVSGLMLLPGESPPAPTTVAALPTPAVPAASREAERPAAMPREPERVAPPAMAVLQPAPVATTESAVPSPPGPTATRAAELPAASRVTEVPAAANASATPAGANMPVASTAAAVPRAADAPTAPGAVPVLNGPGAVAALNGPGVVPAPNGPRAADAPTASRAAGAPAVPGMAGADTAAGSGEDHSPPVQSVALPLPPLAPKVPPPRAATRPDRIDRACSQALFRFQQGVALTAAEAAHVRNGCATRR